MLFGIGLIGVKIVVVIENVYSIFITMSNQIPKSVKQIG